MKVEASLHTARLIPSTELLKKKISGSIDGDAIQKDITGARGTPPIRSELMTGITPQEQKGLKAPMHVARKTETRGFFPNALVMYLDAPERFIITESGIVTSRYGQMWRNDFTMKSEILIICSMV
jgi:hypothetical protein